MILLCLLLPVTGTACVHGWFKDHKSVQIIKKKIPQLTLRNDNNSSMPSVSNLKREEKERIETAQWKNREVRDHRVGWQSAVQWWRGWWEAGGSWEEGSGEAVSENVPQDFLRTAAHTHMDVHRNTHMHAHAHAYAEMHSKITHLNLHTHICTNTSTHLHTDVCPHTHTIPGSMVDERLWLVFGEIVGLKLLNGVDPRPVVLCRCAWEREREDYIQSDRCQHVYLLNLIICWIIWALGSGSSSLTRPS